MAISRRSFLAEATSAGLLPTFLPSLLGATQQSDVTPRAASQPTAGEVYWSSLYKSGAERGRRPHFANENRDPLFAYFEEESGLKWVEDNESKVDRLPSFDDDAVVTLELGGFRAGKQDEPKLGSVRFAQMHLSCQQVKGSDFIGPLAWAALATVFADKAKNLPTMQDLNIMPGQPAQTMPGAPQLNHVLLSQGAGHLAVNITTTPTTSMLDKILGGALKVGKIVSPLLGFPAISLPALVAFYDFYGKLERADRGNFLINTSLKDIVVTQKGAISSDVSSKAIRLLGGYYVLVPTSQRSVLQDEMSNLVVQGGYLVRRKDVDSNLALQDRVKNAVPELTYVTLHANVKAASDFTSGPAKSAPPADGNQNEKSKDKPKNKPKEKGSK
jgi:hypothetical protein